VIQPRIAIEADADALLAARQDGALWRYPDGYRSGPHFVSFHTVQRLSNRGYLQKLEATETAGARAILTMDGTIALFDFLRRRHDGQHRSAA
jgi:hypothetical protein